MSLIDSGNSKKYVLYAIGEILLVMIGILLALQVNNWNEKRKNNLLEKSYYCRLYEDILQDREQIEKFLSQAEERLIDANHMLRMFQVDEINAKKLHLQYFKILRDMAANFQPNNSAYDDLKSGGNLNLIKDISLKNYLNNYFKNIENYNRTAEQYIAIVNERYHRFAEKQIESGMLTAFLDVEEIGLDRVSFEEDIYEQLELEKIETLPKELREVYYNLAINLVINMDRRRQLYSGIKAEVIKLEGALSPKC